MSSPGPDHHTLTTILAALPDPVVAIAPGGDMVYVSPSAADLLRSEPDLDIALKAIAAEVLLQGGDLTKTIVGAGGRRWGCRARLAEDSGPAPALIVLREEQIDLRAELDAAKGDNRVLIQEVHHRVKNSLQVVSAMLRMQSWRLGESGLRRPFEEACNRILTLATVHEVLYRQGSPSSVDFLIVLDNLVSELSHQCDAARSFPKVTLSGETVMLTLDQAIPAALIVQEWLTAAEGDVAITVQGSGVVRFTGQPALDPAGLGGRMVAVLAAQLHGRVEFLSGPPDVHILHLQGDDLGAMAGRNQELAEIPV